MDINRANLDALMNTYSTAFNAGLTAAAPANKPNRFRRESIAMEATVGGSAVVHAWLETLPTLTKLVGTRAIRNLSSKKLTIANDDYASGVSVKANELKDDTFGIYTPLIRALGVNSGRLWDKLAIDALIANGNWADGAPFFGTTRKYGANTISNKTTSALESTTFKAAIEAMRGYKDSENEALEVEPMVLLVGPKLEETAFNLVKNTLVTAGTGKGGAVQNWAAGIVELQVSNRLVGDYDDYWFILGEQAGLLPVFVQKREEPTLVAQDDPGNDAAFLNKEFRYGVDARGAAFLTFPHLAYAGIL
jgi:phage major head subunit gpT-like protein